ncbi:MAG: hypothetical protein ABII12_11405 [Planctomycetota bacterium]
MTIYEADEVKWGVQGLAREPSHIPVAVGVGQSAHFSRRRTAGHSLAHSQNPRRRESLSTAFRR